MFDAKTTERARSGRAQLACRDTRKPGFPIPLMPTRGDPRRDEEARRHNQPSVREEMYPEILEPLTPISLSLSLSLSLSSPSGDAPRPPKKREERGGVERKETRERARKSLTDGRGKAGWVGTNRLVDLRSWWGPLGGWVGRQVLPTRKKNRAAKPSC